MTLRRSAKGPRTAEPQQHGTIDRLLVFATAAIGLKKIIYLKAKLGRHAEGLSDHQHKNAEAKTTKKTVLDQLICDKDQSDLPDELDAAAWTACVFVN